MAQVAVTVNGRTYQVSCEDGQEKHLEHLGEGLDKRVSELVESLGQVGEARLLLMVGLLTADELAEAEDQIEILRAELEEASAAREKVTGEIAEAAESIMSRAARRLEDIASRLENA